MNVRNCRLPDCSLPFIVPKKSPRKVYCTHTCYSIHKLQKSKQPYPKIRVNGKRIYLHRYIYEKHTGETLLPTDVIHHIDGNPFNRDISNLEKLDGQKAHLHKHDYHKKSRIPDNYFDDFPF